ncbi:MAG: histidine kinase [Acidaminococcales bacterium]|nr:histidine kinase [Acidaminococcales bacterium]
MKIVHFKWFCVLSTVCLVMLFEFLRHKYLHIVSMDWGNVFVALFAGILFFFWFFAIFRYIEKLSVRMQREKNHLAVLKERDRIARILHDNLAQTLFFLNVKAREIEKIAPLLPQVQELKEAIALADSDLRGNILALGRDKEMPEERDISDIIQENAKILTVDQKLKLNIDIDENAGSLLNAECRQKIGRVLREIFVNIKKHAQARSVSLKLSRRGRTIILCVKDDGHGFAAVEGRTGGNSFGLRSIAQDIEAIGGAVAVESDPARGTAIKIKFDFSGEGQRCLSEP